MTAPDLQVLDRPESLRLLGGGQVGRIVYTAHALPAVQPVNYVLDGETIVLRTMSLAKLATAGRRDIVAFEVDQIDPTTATGWSVVVTGRIREVVDPAEIARLATLPLHSWVLDGNAGRYLQISCDMVTGRRLVQAPADLRPGLEPV